MTADTASVPSAPGGRLCLFLQLAIVAGVVLSVVQADAGGVGAALVMCGLCALSYQQWPRAVPQSMVVAVLLGLLVFVIGFVSLIFGLGAMVVGASPLPMLLLMPVGVTIVLGPFVWVLVFLRTTPRRRLGHALGLLLLGTWLWLMRPVPLPAHDTFHPYLWECAPMGRRDRMAQDFLDRPGLSGMPVARVEALLGKPTSDPAEVGLLRFDLIEDNIFGGRWLALQVEEGVVVDGWIEQEEFDDGLD